MFHYCKRERLLFNATMMKELMQNTRTAHGTSPLKICTITYAYIGHVGNKSCISSKFTVYINDLYHDLEQYKKSVKKHYIIKENQLKGIFAYQYCIAD